MFFNISKANTKSSIRDQKNADLSEIAPTVDFGRIYMGNLRTVWITVRRSFVENPNIRPFDDFQSVHVQTVNCCMTVVEAWTSTYTKKWGGQNRKNFGSKNLTFKNVNQKSKFWGFNCFLFVLQFIVLIKSNFIF